MFITVMSMYKFHCTTLKGNQNLYRFSPFRKRTNVPARFAAENSFQMALR
jgi:hypothetical protein